MKMTLVRVEELKRELESFGRQIRLVLMTKRRLLSSDMLMSHHRHSSFLPPLLAVYARLIVEVIASIVDSLVVTSLTPPVEAYVWSERHQCPMESHPHPR